MLVELIWVFFFGLLPEATKSTKHAGDDMTLSMLEVALR